MPRSSLPWLGAGGGRQDLSARSPLPRREAEAREEVPRERETALSPRQEKGPDRIADGLRADSKNWEFSTSASARIPLWTMCSLRKVGRCLI